MYKCYSRYKNVPIPDLQDLSYLYDWKEWLSPHIRDIQHHSFHQTFQFINQNDDVVMFYKNTPLDQNWTGYHTTYGYQLLHSYPTGKPKSILPPKFSKEDLKDIPSMFQFMDESNQTWWKKFIQDQSIIHPTNEYITRFDDDFWIDSNEDIFENLDVKFEEENT